MEAELLVHHYTSVHATQTTIKKGHAHRKPPTHHKPNWRKDLPSASCRCCEEKQQVCFSFVWFCLDGSSLLAELAGTHQYTSVHTAVRCAEQHFCDHSTHLFCCSTKYELIAGHSVGLACQRDGELKWCCASVNLHLWKYNFRSSIFHRYLFVHLHCDWRLSQQQLNGYALFGCCFLLLWCGHTL